MQLLVVEDWKNCRQQVTLQRSLQAGTRLVTAIMPVVTEVSYPVAQPLLLLPSS